MVDRSQVDKVLSEILESPEFKDAQRYRDLLVYLVEESLAGRSPKETTIGLQFFGKDSSFNSKEDATVRVYLNNLRKKLEHYYLTSGKDASVRLLIPVGHYRVDFLPTSGRTENGAKVPKAALWTAAVVGLACVFVLGYWLGSRSPEAPPQPAVPNSLWTEYVQPQARPILVVLGDYFFMREQNPVSSYYRTVPINSVEDFQERAARNPEFARRYQPLEFTYLRPSATRGLIQILPILERSPQGYSFKLASEFSTADFKTHNIVYLGTVKTLYTFRKFLHIFGMERRMKNDYEQIVLHGEKMDSVQTFFVGGQRSVDYVKDYPIIAKGAGPEGSTILLLMGFTENGAIAAPRSACDATLLQAVKSKYPNQPLDDPLYCTLVLETEGLLQAVFKTDIRYFAQNKPLFNISDISHQDTLTPR
jgi:hypothetical protein